MKVYAFNIQKEAQEFYLEEAQKYNYHLTFVDKDLTKETMVDIESGTKAVILSHISPLIDHDILSHLKNNGVEHIVTASAGYDHIDIEAATKLGFKIGRVPAYSPTSVASWTFATGLQLVRKTGMMFHHATKFNFTIDKCIFANEFKNLTVGVIGTGKIGTETVKYFNSVGFKVVVNDMKPNPEISKIAEYTDLDSLLSQSDLVVLHIPYFKNVNDEFVNQAFLKKMKSTASLINASRGALVNELDVLNAIKENEIYGFASDVFLNEIAILNNQLTGAELSKLNENLLELLAFYPRVLISQHVAYFTDEAIKNMASTTFLNIDQLSKTKTCDTVIN